MKINTHLDLLKNEIRNAVLQNLSTAPSSPVAGQVYFDTTDGAFKIYNGTAWVVPAAGVTSFNGRTGGVSPAPDDYSDQDITNTQSGDHFSDTTETNISDVILALDSAITDVETSLAGKADTAHTHTASQITDFDTAVRTSRLDQMAAPTASVSLNSQKITNLATGTASTDAVNKGQMDTAISDAFAANDAMTFKGGIDASGNPNYPAGNAGDTYKITVAGKIGGASGRNVQVGDTITCTVDSSASGNEASVGANWIIMQTNMEYATVGETEAKTRNDVVVTPEGLATFPRKYTSTIGNGSATSITVTHNLGSKDVISQIRYVSDDSVALCDIVNTSTTQTTFTFATAPATNEFAVTIVG